MGGNGKWFINNIEQNVGQIELETSFDNPGKYYVCHERTGNNCIDRQCNVVLISGECSNNVFLQNGSFDIYNGSSPIDGMFGNFGKDFIDNELTNWSVLRRSPEHWFNFDNDIDNDDYIGVASKGNSSLTGSELQEGVFQCFDFIVGNLYNICLDVKGMGKRLPNTAYAYSPSDGLLELYATNGLIEGIDNPQIGQELIASLINLNFEEWTSVSIPYTPNADFSFFTVVSSSRPDLEDSYFFFDNIQYKMSPHQITQLTAILQVFVWVNLLHFLLKVDHLTNGLMKMAI